MFLFLKVRVEELFREREVKRLYYGDPTFRAKDKALKRLYRFSNPYAICRKFNQMLGRKRIHTYGETPLPLIEKVGVALNLQERDTLYELGSGRGRSALFFDHFFDCEVVALEEVPDFVDRGLRLGLDMRCLDYFDADLSDATALFLSDPTLSSQEIRVLARKLANTNKPMRIATVSYPLNPYHKGFKTTHHFLGEFPWGEAKIYINERRQHG